MPITACIFTVEGGYDVEARGWVDLGVRVESRKFHSYLLLQ